ncbi:helix-turn-helix domain-containing protein [Rugamonas rubra]|uniref:helix-turn-helix domain-containing protein n=1 Tax=Rugamonas rubra TaxID=758825 RepID=UPI003CCC07E5
MPPLSGLPPRPALAAPAAPATATVALDHGAIDGAALEQAVRDFRGTRRALAAHLGLSERTLYRRLKALGLA